MSTLLEKMMKAGTTKHAAVLASSPFFNQKESIPTELPILNIAFSGSLDGGLLPGLTIFAGASKSFKTMLALYCMKAYLDKYKDGIAILYDSEFGVTPEYIESFDIDINRVLHIPIKDVEELKFDIVKKLEEVEKKEKVFIMIDSIGNLASKKELEDAQNEKSVADMSRAKSLKSLFRIITPYLTTKSIPCIAINHIYMEQCLAGETLIRTTSGNKQIKDIEIGDKVYALNGTQKVTHIFGPDFLDGEGKKFLELEFDDGSKVRCTHDHKFLISDNTWKEAIDLKIGEIFY
jgi:RecA/RadA recombinase